MNVLDGGEHMDVQHASGVVATGRSPWPVESCIVVHQTQRI